jgi:uncharacterized protein YndB with AHSA1/START domain
MPLRATLQVDLSDRTITISRDFRASRESLFRAWTTKEGIAAWWGPKGFRTDVRELDLRVGGRYHFVMIDADGNEYPVQGEYSVVEPPSKLVMSDDIRCMPREWLEENAAEELASGAPIEGWGTLTLTDLGDGMTRLTLATRCINDRIRDGLVAAGMNEGFDESFDKLEDWLEAAGG